MKTFLLLSFATYRLSSLLTNEAGPGDIFPKLRKLMGVYYDEYSERRAKSWVGDIFNCIWCMSVWVAFGLSVAQVLFKRRGWFETLFVTPLAISGLAVMIHQLAGEK